MSGVPDPAVLFGVVDRRRDRLVAGVQFAFDLIARPPTLQAVHRLSDDPGPPHGSGYLAPPGGDARQPGLRGDDRRLAFRGGRFAVDDGLEWAEGFDRPRQLPHRVFDVGFGRCSFHRMLVEQKEATLGVDERRRRRQHPLLGGDKVASMAHDCSNVPNRRVIPSAFASGVTYAWRVTQRVPGYRFDST